jgi:hypothetical protein
MTAAQQLADVRLRMATKREQAERLHNQFLLQRKLYDRVIGEIVTLEAEQWNLERAEHGENRGR